jgi:hypothetical protein
VLSSARPKIAIALAALALGAGASLPAQAAAQDPIQLGVYLSGGGGNASTLDDYASLTGATPDILLAFRSMSGPIIYSSEINNLRARGETPMITIEPYVGGGVASLTDIAAGKYDAYFRKEAKAIKATGITVMLRFAHEMNLLSSDWGPNKAGNTGSGYVDAWRHVVTLFREEGASNVEWVWAPNVDYGGRPFTQFYPGDDYVDYVGLDGYNWGTSGGEAFANFSKIFASSYATATALSSKPVIITETACSETGGSKAAWIEETYLKTIPEKFPRIAGVIWFNDDKERDWRVNSSQASLDAYRKVVASTLYGGSETPTVATPAPTVKDLEVVPVITPVAVPVSASPAEKTKGRGRGIRLSGRVIYRLSRRSTVRVALHRRGAARPLVFSAVQDPGRKRVALSRLVGDRRVGRGRYSVSVVAFSTDSGSRSEPRRHGFKVVPPGRSRRG